MSSIPHRELAAAAADLARARRVLVITGAGVSAASGLPVYRGLGGLYDRGETVGGHPIEVALSGAMLRQRPEITWRCLRQIGEALAGKQPNAAHLALAAMEGSGRFERFTVLTQNVDGLHARAGSKDLIEMHGDLAELRCPACGHAEPMPAAMPPGVPRCPRCGDGLRPSIVLFGEALPEAALARYEAALAARPDFVMSIGTSAGFPYIAGPFAQAARAGLPTLEINPASTEVSGFARHRLRACAAVALPQLWRALDPARLPVPLPGF